MPLADVSGVVAGIVQDARQAWRFRVEPVRHAALLVELPAIEVGRDAPARGILARDQRAARRAADRRVDVEPAEPQALAREAVDLGRLHARAAEAAQIAVAHVVDQHEQHVRPGRRSARRLRAGRLDVTSAKEDDRQERAQWVEHQQTSPGGTIFATTQNIPARHPGTGPPPLCFCRPTFCITFDSYAIG